MFALFAVITLLMTGQTTEAKRKDTFDTMQACLKAAEEDTPLVEEYLLKEYRAHKGTEYSLEMQCRTTGERDA